jgi:hypothetical protein
MGGFSRRSFITTLPSSSFSTVTMRQSRMDSSTIFFRVFGPDSFQRSQ